VPSDITRPSHPFILDTVSERYGEPSFCFFYGSHAFGRGDADSDIDVIVVMNHLAHAYRERFSSNGFLFDALVHDPETLHAVMRSEHKRGVAVLTAKVDQSLVLPQPCELASKLKEIARGLLRSGPPRPEKWDLPRRYMTAVLSDIGRCADRDERRMMAMDLYECIIDTFLRSHGRFSNRGRYLVREVKRFDAAFSDRGQAALAAVFQNDSLSPLIQLAREVLDSVGGTLDDGYREDFSDKMRSPLR
jgi:predicted nucleotidyltransferase